MRNPQRRKSRGTNTKTKAHSRNKVWGGDGSGPVCPAKTVQGRKERTLIVGGKLVGEKPKHIGKGLQKEEQTSVFPVLLGEKV